MAYFFPSLSQIRALAEQFDEIAELTLQEVSLLTNPAFVTLLDVKAVLTAVN